MSRNSLLETDAILEVYVTATGIHPHLAHEDIAPVSSKVFLDIHATIECGFINNSLTIQALSIQPTATKSSVLTSKKSLFSQI